MERTASLRLCQNSYGDGHHLKAIDYLMLEVVMPRQTIMNIMEMCDRLMFLCPRRTALTYP